MDDKYRELRTGIFRGAIGGMKWSALAALVFGIALLLQGESLAMAIMLEGMMMVIWITIAALVGFLRAFIKQRSSLS